MCSTVHAQVSVFFDALAAAVQESYGEAYIETLPVPSVLQSTRDSFQQAVDDAVATLRKATLNSPGKKRRRPSPTSSAESR